MTFRVEIEGDEKVKMQLQGASEATQMAAKKVQKAQAENLKKECEATSPVDTGLYKSNWKVTSEQDTYYVRNPTWYGQYLVYPNGRMVGSPKADLPQKGIIHNVRGIVQRHKKKYRNNMITEIQEVLKGMGQL